MTSGPKDSYFATFIVSYTYNRILTSNLEKFERCFCIVNIIKNNTNKKTNMHILYKHTVNSHSSLDNMR